MRNYSYGNEFVLHENEDAGKTHFHMNGFALRLVLTLRQKRTRKWPIYSQRTQNIGALESQWKRITSRFFNDFAYLLNLLLRSKSPNESSSYNSKQSIHASPKMYYSSQ